MTNQELDAQLKIYQYHRQVLEEMFPNMFGCTMGDRRQQDTEEEERYSQEGN